MTKESVPWASAFKSAMTLVIQALAVGIVTDIFAVFGVDSSCCLSSRLAFSAIVSIRLVSMGPIIEKGDRETFFLETTAVASVAGDLVSRASRGKGDLEPFPPGESLLLALGFLVPAGLFMVVDIRRRRMITGDKL